MAHVLARERCSHSASRTASGSRTSTRAQRVSSAEDITCACRPQIPRTTPSASSRGALRSRRWRIRRQASTSGQVSRAFGRTNAPPVRMLTDEFYGRRAPLPLCSSHHSGCARVAEKSSCEGWATSPPRFPYTRGVTRESREGEPMSETAPLRVVTTHDFCCSYLPSPTSYGSLPGGEGLKRTVDGLREEGPAVWADVGDCASPGALATLSGGTAGFEAAADLGIDVGAVGNLDFNRSVEHLR